jgi:acyl-CoA synthetase (AMP-forming)/AMP-acid ligase II/1-acyl-sn-glycerol-3-phosphate acyltransferase/acyl carrier protein
MVPVRYKVELHGINQVKKKRNRRRSGGLLFLPNHPAQTDPLILISRIWKKFQVRPMVVEGIFYVPGLNFLFDKLMDAVPVPAFERAANSYKLWRADRATQEVIEGLRRGENFAVWPSGRLRKTPDERVGGASMVYEILQAVPEANVVLVRTTGMWGSMFSWALTGQRPPLLESTGIAIKIILKNLIFFVPKRKVTIDFEMAPDELYVQEGRAPFNSWLERWYNYGAGQPEHLPGEPIKLVSYSRWKTEFPLVTYHTPYHEADISRVPVEVQRQVVREVARLSRKKTSEIRPEMHLFTDLALDSLEVAELITSVEQTQGVVSRSWHLDLLTVGAVMALVAGSLDAKKAEVLAEPPPKGWKEAKRRRPVQPGEGETLLEAFLRCCDRMGEAVACADERSGVFTYKALKRQVLLAAALLRQVPGENVGILLPATVAAQTIVLASYLAGKTPVMINWTIGSRYLQHVIATTGIEAVVSSWTFLDNLDGVDLTPIHQKIMPLEQMRLTLGLRDLLKARKLAKLRADKLIDELKLHTDRQAMASVLFTSGTEALPKAVPLTHANILHNQAAAFEKADLRASDILYSALPPFHSFGFTITGLLPLVVGMRVFYGPDPTDAPQMVHDIMRYRATVYCSAPTFIAGLLAVAKPEQLRTLRMFISGAEKAPTGLFGQLRALSAHLEILEGYGITECSPIITVTERGHMPRGVGTPIRGLALKIVHPVSHEPLSQGETGLILVRGPSVFSGYLGETGRETFITIDGDQWYNTGDLGSIDETGTLFLAGRLKRFVKIGAEMISLPAIEAGLEEAAIRNEWGSGRRDRALAVVALEPEEGRPRFYLFANFFVDLDEANEALRQLGFSNLVRIHRYEHVPEMPRMGTGKIDYRALEAAAQT